MMNLEKAKSEVRLPIAEDISTVVRVQIPAGPPQMRARYVSLTYLEAQPFWIRIVKSMSQTMDFNKWKVALRI
jgi:hypothetical protein